MTRVRLLQIDESCILACDIDEAIRHLDSTNAIRAWFSARRIKASVTVTTPSTTLTIDDIREQWLPAHNALVVDGHIGNARIHGHLTIRAVVRSISTGLVDPGTEIWAHVELQQPNPGPNLEPALRHIIGRGLAHIRHELDTTPTRTGQRFEAAQP